MIQFFFNLICLLFSLLLLCFCLLTYRLLLLGSVCFCSFHCLSQLHSSQAANAGLVNGVILVSCVAWTYGFLLLLQWTLSLPGPLDTVGLTGGALKLLASVLFCVQPFSGLLEQGWGVSWSNLAGVSLFHIGNFIS